MLNTQHTRKNAISTTDSAIRLWHQHCDQPHYDNSYIICHFHLQLAASDNTGMPCAHNRLLIFAGQNRIPVWKCIGKLNYFNHIFRQMWAFNCVRWFGGESVNEIDRQIWGKRIESVGESISCWAVSLIKRAARLKLFRFAGIHYLDEIKVKLMRF